MFYPQSKEKLTAKRFKNPENCFRAAPFWAWNTTLEKQELLRQIDVFKEMGFGGFHIHSRVGMATPYLSKEFFDLVKDCNEKGKQNNMLTYLYDEDRWPSGFAGGFVTKHEEFRQVYLRFQTEEITYDRAKLLAVYDINVNENGVAEYKIISKENKAQHQKWYAYIDKEPGQNAWFNNQCYVDVLNPKATDEFLKVTHKAYKKYLGEEFKKSVPSIFTDEPQYTHINVYETNDNFMLPWTPKFCEIYKEQYGEDVAEKLPEIFFETKGGYSKTRYNFYELISKLFAENYFDKYGNWCDKNGIAMTGHILGEGSLYSQSVSVGDAMRNYLAFTMPGVDMLMNSHEFVTVKQAVSVARQKGAEGVLCELDGVTNWDFDFRGHKMHGDWQASLGVTLRVPHLSLVSMLGEAKRDYPATINYQVPWYKKYHLIEDYFARVNTVLTRGKAECKVAVLHPIRNLWLTLGQKDFTEKKVESINKSFGFLTEKLVKNHVDFDFLSESNFEKQNVHFQNGKLIVDKAEYDILIIPPMLTLKSTTVDLLKTVKEQKARVVAFGNSPKYMDGKPSIVPNEVFRLLETKPYSIESVIGTIDEYRSFEIVENGSRSNDYCAQMRIDGLDKWLFIAKASEPDRKDVSEHNITININGDYVVSGYNCENGEIYNVDAVSENGFTTVNLDVFAHDSVMFKLSNKKEENATKMEQNVVSNLSEIENEVDYSLAEENVYLIDKAQFSFDGGEFETQEDILRKDNELRERIALRTRGEGIEQPWVNKEKPENAHKIKLKHEFSSKIRYKNAFLALENAKDCVITFNGKTVSNEVVGYYVDKCIDKVLLGTIKKGVNTLEVEMPFGETTNTENMYILGDFGVFDSVSPYIDKLPKKLHFGDLAEQGFLFYGGNVDYILPEISAEKIFVPYYKGALIEVLSKGESLGEIIYAPYTFNIANKKNITLRLYGTRINTFGQLHNVLHDKFGWFGPFSWRTAGDEWTNEYLSWEQGILLPPKTDNLSVESGE